MIKLTLVLLLALPTYALSGEREEAYKRGDIIVVEPGNTLPTIPEIPKVSLDRYASYLTNLEYIENPLPFYEGRSKIILNRLMKKYNNNQFSLAVEIKRAAEIYGIDPVHIVAAIVGEHTFNVDLFDNVQEYSIRLKIWKSHFKSDEHEFLEVTRCPEMSMCSSSKSEADRWDCYAQVWNRKLRGKKMVCNNSDFSQKEKNKGLIMAFFDPTTAGKTYGLGQLGPVTVLSLTDEVNRMSGFSLLSLERIGEVYEATLDPKITVHYMAAQIASSIKLYKEIAGFDISENPGLVATLYNLGAVKGRAYELKRRNDQFNRKNQAIVEPQVNYYGWFVNHIETDLRKFLSQ